MNTQYKINGTATSIGPVEVKWIPQIMGVDHNGQPVFSANYEIELSFDGGSVTHTREWIQGTSSGSVNLTVLNRQQLGFTTLSGVYVAIQEEPYIRDINTGPFKLLVRNVTI